MTDRLPILALVVAALLAAIPGSHLLELWLTRRDAIVVSHAAGLVLLGVAMWRWRGRRNPPDSERIA